MTNWSKGYLIIYSLIRFHILVSGLKSGLKSWKVVTISSIEKLTLCIWAITSVWEQLWRAFPLISRISSATSRSALSAGEPEMSGLMRLILIKNIKSLLTVKFDTFVIGLNQNNDVTSKIDHSSPLVLHVALDIFNILFVVHLTEIFSFSATFWFSCHCGM